MRLSNFLVTFSACALFAACANDEMPGGNNLPQGNGEQAFIAVRLMAPNTMTKGFQAGSDAENAVTKGRFYFFNSEGGAVTVNTTDNTNYIDESTLNFSSSSGNVEETTASPILVLDGSTDEWPTQMVVVLNPPSALDNTSKTLDNLRAAAAGYDGATSGQFVMSNSVYLDGSSQKVDAVNISDNITTTAEAAQGNPVTVYVERVLARVDVDGTGDMDDNTDGTGTTNDKINGYSGSNGTTEVQAVVKGWALTNRNSQSHLLKNFASSGWNATTPFSGWNDANNYRSYWAYTADITAAKATNDSYSQMLTEATSAIPANKYCQENTGTTDNTELVVIAELQVDGTATSIARYAGQYWLPNNLLTQFANQILAGRIYYKAEGTGTPDSYTALTADLLKLRPRTSAEASTVAAYEAVLDLKNTYATGYTFASDQSGTSALDLDEVKDILNDYTALLWHNGKTYYHLPVNHALASETSTTKRPGIVRNHLYKINLTGVSGLGTPIPGDTAGDDPGDDDPDDKPIDPEDPDEEESFLAAEINILSWNVIGQNVELGKD